MAVLKQNKNMWTTLYLVYRLKGSTLMETLVATVLIVVVFIMASMVLNTIFSSSIKNNTRAIKAQLNQLQYLKLNDKLELPYQESLGDWSISVEKYIENNQTIIEFEATNINTNKTIERKENETK
ncbi:PulJ/GspJ family protein [Olleya namhaensis]|uniref:Prepilin-type N-terminal cleavage/methylation domain-containing protein n=1 Tax=Olleya namhaensis TaxID=1144750 RepID=A0A1I3MT77_9FLAO|nr:hypothetical protein [Olleya namhaensis]SFJ00131.1 hypothetical protein SAMN05443431_103293 [Olleya namhaensis]